MFSEAPADQEAAKGLCQDCRLVVRCAVKAFRKRESAGVWGGFTADERRGIVVRLRSRVDGGA